MAAATLYSVDEVATVLGLHVRTVRGYVRDGRLPAVRIGKQYRIAADDLSEFTEGRAVPPPARAPADVTVQVEVSSIVQVDGVDQPTMTRLSALISGAVSSRHRSGDADRLHVQTVYDQQRQSLKIVVIGGPEDTSALVSLIGAFARTPK